MVTKHIIKENTLSLSPSKKNKDKIANNLKIFTDISIKDNAMNFS